MTPLPSVASLIGKLETRGVTLPPGPVRVDGFGDSEALSTSLLALIRSGAQACRHRPSVGLRIRWRGNRQDWRYRDRHRSSEPAGASDANHERDGRAVPYDEVTAEYAAIEGEGDGSLEYWRTAHWAFFSRECKRIGREPQGSMPVVCSIFEVLNVLPPSREP